jgi:hypothetical protein
MISTTLLSGFAAAARVGVARLEAARRTGDDYELCRALAGLASLQIHVGGEARGPAQGAVELARRVGNLLLLSSSLYVLVIRLSTQALASCLANSHEKEDLRVRSETTTVAISLRLIQGATQEEVSSLIEQGLAVARELDDPYYLAHATQRHRGRR